MTSSIKPTALKTLATIGVATLALAACGNDAASGAEEPTEAVTDAPVTEAPEVEDPEDDSQGAGAYEAALANLTYDGLPLEMAPSEELAPPWAGSPITIDDPEPLTSEPAECKDLLLASVEQTDNLLSDTSKALFARTTTDENMRISAQIWPGAAEQFDLDLQRELADSCAYADVLENGYSVMNFSAVDVTLPVQGADDVYAEQIGYALGDATPMLASFFAKVGDNLVIIHANPDVADYEELLEITNQVVSALQ